MCVCVSDKRMKKVFLRPLSGSAESDKSISQCANNVITDLLSRAQIFFFYNYESVQSLAYKHGFKITTK